MQGIGHHGRWVCARTLHFEEVPLDDDLDLLSREQLADKYKASDDKMNQIFADSSKVSGAEVTALADINKVQAQTLPLIEKVVALK